MISICNVIKVNKTCLLAVNLMAFIIVVWTALQIFSSGETCVSFLIQTWTGNTTYNYNTFVNATSVL